MFGFQVNAYLSVVLLLVVSVLVRFVFERSNYALNSLNEPDRRHRAISEVQTKELNKLIGTSGHLMFCLQCDPPGFNCWVSFCFSVLVLMLLSSTHLKKFVSALLVASFCCKKYFDVLYINCLFVLVDNEGLSLLCRYATGSK